MFLWEERTHFCTAAENVTMRSEPPRKATKRTIRVRPGSSNRAITVEITSHSLTCDTVCAYIITFLFSQYWIVGTGFETHTPVTEREFPRMKPGS